MPKLPFDYEACHIEGLRINFDHLGFFNVHQMHGTQAFLHFTFSKNVGNERMANTTTEGHKHEKYRHPI